MAEETTTQAGTTTSTVEVTAVAAPSEQSPATDAKALETAKGDTGAETSLLGGEVKPEGEAKLEAEAPVVPEKYELAVEGMEIDATAIEEATPVFKELGLSNDQAGKLMPVAAKFRDRVAEATLQQLADAGAAQKSDWMDATKADPDIGGGKLKETLHLASKGLDHFGFPEGSDFRKLLTETGFGNNPDMVRLMRGVGEMISEDGFPRAGATSASQISVEKRLYPND